MAIRDLGPRGVIEGEVDEGYGAVADAFIAGFLERGEVGAAVAVHVDGRRVVDLWGGIADATTGRPWTPETPGVVHSCTKGIVAICAWMLAQEGRLEMDAPVARYWPEFAAAGKGSVTVRMLLSHRAGLPIFDTVLSREEVLAWTPVVDALAAQAPYWTPGTDHSYHAITYGWLVGEVIRRVSGLTPGRFVRERLAGPLGLRTWIGVPPEVIPEIAPLRYPLPPADPEAMRLEALAVPAIADRIGSVNGALPLPGEPDRMTYNDPAVLAAEVPGANGVTDARSLSQLYAACVSPILGAPLLSDATIDEAVIVRTSGRMRFSGPDSGHRWGTGFMLDSPPARRMLGPRSFGHDGAGGTLGFGDADFRVGFGYGHNQMGGSPERRAAELVEALRGCLGD
ncbi:MAG: serine hydrolase domain-containing protein [Chloroflexota bacterium]